LIGAFAQSGLIKL